MGSADLGGSQPRPREPHGKIRELSCLARRRHRIAVLTQFAGSQALSSRNGDAALMTYTWRTGRGARAAESDSLLMAISLAAAVVLDLLVSKNMQFGEHFCDGKTIR